MKSIMLSNKGETVMESIVSLLILGILFLSITTMLQASLRITASSTEKAKELQENINSIIIGDYTSSNEDAVITFKTEGIEAIEASHSIILNTDTDLNIVAFTPNSLEVEP